MKNFSSWLLVIFMVMFWLFRAIVALCTQFSIDLLGLISYNFNIEVVIIFLTLLCIVLVVKRKLIGSLLYLALYGVYFGEHLVMGLMTVVEGTEAITMQFTTNILSDLVAILLAIFVLLDTLVDKGRKVSPSDRKTDWYFKNEKYDEELKARDQREDKNEYKFY